MNAVIYLPGIGHNHPPAELEPVTQAEPIAPVAPVDLLRAALNPRFLDIMLAGELAPHSVAADALLAEFTRFVAATETGISTDAVGAAALDFREELDAALAALDTTRTTIKAPVLAAQRAIDGAAKVIAEPVTAARAEVNRRYTGFLRFKDEEIRRIAREEADRLEKAAWDAAAEASETGEVAKLDEARDARAGQRAAEDVLFAPALENTRMKTAAGNTSGLKDDWKFEATDLAAVPAAFLMLNEKMVKAAIASGTRKIPGIRIYNDPRAR